MLWIGTVCIVVAAAILWGPVVSNVEQARYSVVTAEDNIEVRDYAPMIVAETEISGERQQAINQGFRLIADYIFGNNVASQKVAMTAPVMQQTSARIAMTAPVTQQGNGSTWHVRFVMPASYTMATLPKPGNSAVKLVEIPARRFAVIRFSGLATQGNLERETALLDVYLQKQRLQASSTPVYAFFNPPWTLPFLRRNEVMVQIAQ